MNAMLQHLFGLPNALEEAVEQRLDRRQAPTASSTESDELFAKAQRATSARVINRATHLRETFRDVNSANECMRQALLEYKQRRERAAAGEPAQPAAAAGSSELSEWESL